LWWMGGARWFETTPSGSPHHEGWVFDTNKL
jgi:hypothetical protein